MLAVRSTTHAFPLLLSPSPSSQRLPSLPIMAKRKARAEELEAQAESNGYKREAHREKDSTRDNGKHNKKTKTSQNSVLDRYGMQGISFSARANLVADIPNHSRTPSG